jgi:ATP-dependent Clp protease adaptor protein ClpS
MSTDVTISENVECTLQPPNLWNVVFHNDDQTPMELVIEILVNLFKLPEQQAIDVTLEIHNSGSAIAGIYPFDIAEQKALESVAVARANGAPLMVTAEQD